MIFLRLVRKNIFWSLIFFAKPSFSEFHQSSVKTHNFLEPEKLFFLQSHACMIFLRLVRKKKNGAFFLAKPSFSEFHESSVEKTIF